MMRCARPKTSSAPAGAGRAARSGPRVALGGMRRLRFTRGYIPAPPSGAELDIQRDLTAKAHSGAECGLKEHQDQMPQARTWSKSLLCDVIHFSTPILGYAPSGAAHGQSPSAPPSVAALASCLATLCHLLIAFFKDLQTNFPEIFRACSGIHRSCFTFPHCRLSSPFFTPNANRPNA